MSDEGRNLSVDLLIVGAGVAGLSAATAAARSGRSVLVIEKSDSIGGTARFANGSIWIPNNDLAVRIGIHHDAEAEIRFILSECCDSFDASKPWCGASEQNFKRVENYVRLGAKVIRELEKGRIQSFTQLDSIFRSYFFSQRDSVDAAEQGLEHKAEASVNSDATRAARSSWDYHWENPHNTVPYGKHIWATIDLVATGKFFFQGLRKHFLHILINLVSIRSFASLFDQVPKLFGKFWGFGHGFILVERFRRHLKRTDVDLLTRHTLISVQTDQRRVVSVDIQTPSGQVKRWQVRDGLIVASGCYSHQLTLNGSQEFPIRSSCVATSNDGDALRILKELDVEIEPTPRPLLAESVLQLAVKGQGVSHEPVFFLYGDSFFVVDRHGRRVMNEKLNYHDRAYHHVGNADREVLFLICDRRFKERNWGFGIGLPFDLRHLIKAQSPEQLCESINAELLCCNTNVRLADDFATNLSQTRRQFDEFARKGKDDEFGRGENPYDVLGFPKADRDNDCPSRTMYPLTGDKIYACIYCLSAFSTHGGLVCDSDSKVLSKNGEPWDNLYAVGTCAASFLNGHYPAHGMSLGTGLVFGYLAGLHATANLDRLQ